MIKKGNKFIYNVLYAFLAQAVALALSVIMSLVVPKALGVTEYGYWQLFIFYSGYVGFFHFGLNDGLYLRLGGKEYTELDSELIGTQYKISIILETILSVGVIIISQIIIQDDDRFFVIMLTMLYAVVSNASMFLGYIFQAVNRTKIYSLSVIIDRIVVLISIVFLMILGVKSFQEFVIWYLIGKIISLLYCLLQAREIVFSKLCEIKRAFPEFWENISVGIKLTFANITSMLILGSGRLVIDRVWGIEAFGKFSLSISLTNFFLLFISQISMVLFPALRKVDEAKQRSIYKLTRNSLSIFLPIVFLCYVPIRELIGIWLPQYKESLFYLALLLPLCTFDGKMQLLCNTYLKVMRKETILLKNNFWACGVSLVLSIIGGYFIRNIYFIVISLVVAIAFRSIISELYLASLFEMSIVKDLLLELLLVILFMICSWNLRGIQAFFAILFAYILFLVLNKEKTKNILVKIRKIKEEN